MVSGKPNAIQKLPFGDGCRHTNKDFGDGDLGLVHVYSHFECVHIYIYICVFFVSKYLSIYLSIYPSINPSIYLIHIIFPCIPVFCGFFESVPKWHPFLFSRATPKPPAGSAWASWWKHPGAVANKASTGHIQHLDPSIYGWIKSIKMYICIITYIYIYTIYSRTYVHRNIWIYNIWYVCVYLYVHVYIYIKI